jgi:hypothetical protein
MQVTSDLELLFNLTQHQPSYNTAERFYQEPVNSEPVFYFSAAAPNPCFCREELRAPTVFPYGEINNGFDDFWT